MADLYAALSGPGGLEGWQPFFAAPRRSNSSSTAPPEVAAPTTPPALLEEVRAAKLLAQLQAVQKAFLESKLGPRRPQFGGPVVIVPPVGILYTVQVAEAVAAEALLPRVGQPGFEARYQSAIVKYNELFDHAVTGVDWWEFSDSDLE